LNILFLVATIISVVFIKNEGLPILQLFPFVLASMTQLILIFPIYHFEEFEYIPVENPVAEMPENAHLFG
jgi:formate-dependent nitrite reductase membrane component NrfD